MQPSHQPVVGSIRQTPVQGLGASFIIPTYCSPCGARPEKRNDYLGGIRTHPRQSVDPVSLLGRQLFRHKIRKQPLATILLLICIVQIGVAAGLIFVFCALAVPDLA